MSAAIELKPSCERSAQLLSHRPLVVSIARRLLGRLSANVNFDELMQAGMIGLNEAMSRFDDERGASFGTYASRRIEGAMLDELRTMDTLPRRTRAEQRKIRATVQLLEQQLGRAPRAKEVADALGWSLADFHRRMVEVGAGRLREGDTSLEDLADESSARDGADTSEMPFDELADPQRRLESRQRLAALSDALSQLAEREQLVMDMLYARGLHLKEIGAALGVTESRVCQIHHGAVAKLRERLKED